MSAVNNQWSFLGYDLRNVFRSVRSALGELCHSPQSLLARNLAETVRVYEAGQTHFILNNKVVTSGPAHSEALVLPDDQCLCKTVTLPESAEDDLENFLSLEVRASSPFAEEDTRFGWCIIDRKAGMLKVLLVITSNLLVHRFVQSQDLERDLNDYEVWYRSDVACVEIFGYAEGERRVRYTRRLKRFFLLCGSMLALLFLLGWLPVVFKQAEMQKVAQQYEQVRQAAQPAVQLREALGKKREIASQVSTVNTQRYDVINELERLAVLLPDNAFLTSVDMREGLIRIEGLADNASSLMQLLLAEPSYSKVVSPAAFRKEGRSGRERFVFDLTPQIVTPEVLE